jgi:hypothetical protein
MQQVRFRSLQEKHENLRRDADRWDEHARAAYAAGHDVQLHLHSQWSDARYGAGKWELKGEWSLLKYEWEEARQMIWDCKNYLENLLRSIDPDYRCLAFRASALALAPSPHMLTSLVSMGIELDVSMAAGVYLDNDTLQLDYRQCEEPFLPYYPRTRDARLVSDKQHPIVCVPLNHFYGSRREVTKQNVALVTGRLGARGKASTAQKPRAQLDTQTSGVARVYEKLIAPALKRKYFVSDLSRLNYPLMREMLASIRERVRDSGLSKVPVVLTNHPKDIRDWNAIERFVAEVAAAEDIEFVTLSQVASRVKSGDFEVKSVPPA